MDARFLVFVMSSVLVSDYDSDVSSQIMVTIHGDAKRREQSRSVDYYVTLFNSPYFQIGPGTN